MSLEEKIKNEKLVVGVVGLGYVGLPLAVEVAKKGIKTVGLNRGKEKVDLINSGSNYIQDVVDSELDAVVKDKKLEATTDFTRVSEVDVICIAVPTPITKDKKPDLAAVKDASEKIGENLKRDQLVILKSTTFPGTTDEVVLPILEEKSGLKAGKDFYLAFSPERIDPGNETYGTTNTPKVVGGIDEKSTKLAAEFFRLFIKDVHEVSTTKAAEMTKILENSFRLINVSFINEMALIADKMGIDIWEVIEAANTKPFGFMPFYPGPGLGGHCIPVDPYYLSYKAKEYGMETQFIGVSSEIDDYMTEHVVEKIELAASRVDKKIENAKVLVLGAAYKKDIDDFRESPAIKVMELMHKKEVDFDFYDPHVKEFADGDFHMKGLDGIDPQTIGAYDVVAVLTDHSSVDYDMVLKNAKAIVDTRNAIKERTSKVLGI